MGNDIPSRLTTIAAWRLELLAFLVLFLGITAVHSVHELHKLGHPIGGIVFYALVFAACVRGFLILGKVV
jgi:hypothetical protein